MKPDNSSFPDDRNKKHDFVFKKERRLNEIEIAGFFKISKWFVSHKNGMKTLLSGQRKKRSNFLPQKLTKHVDFW